MQEVRFQGRTDHWTKVWPSALAVSRWLLAQVPGTLPASAKELGCGMGLVSMTLAHLGIRAEGTDRNRTALAFALANCERNQLLGFSANHLDWAEPQGEASQLICAADIVYEERAPALLLALLQTSGLLRPGGRLLIGGPHCRRQLLSELLAALEGHGYSHTETTSAVTWDGRTEDIDVHVLRRPA